mgnify:CR=1 FL=1
MSREHRAEALSVRTILHPRSVAVIGASRRRDSIGNTILRNLIKGGYTGEIYPITPVSYTHLRAHETVLDLVCRLLLENKKTRFINYIDEFFDYT